MTTAALIMIDWSFARDLIEFLSVKDIFYLLLELGLIVGVFCTCSIYLEISGSSVP